MRDALAALAVRDEDRAGYESTKFKHWVDADQDGCTTRAEVLKAEAVVQPVRPLHPGSARVWTSTIWSRSPRPGTPASAWSPAEREAYANDSSDERALIAVSAASNRSEADQDPTTWLPPTAGYRCQYVTDWVADKTRWGLTIDSGEEAALSKVLSHCLDAPVTVTLAR